MNDDRTPLVSIVCLTYNHAPYIRECLDGFLMQKTDFPIEVIIHDDASTDGTTDIVREYASTHPEIIKPIIQTENQYKKNKGYRNIIKNCLQKASAEIIAFCEGDDYWITSDKLTKQFNAMKSLGADLIYTDLMFINNDGIINNSMFKNKLLAQINSYNQLLSDALYMAPCTWMIKRKWFEQDHGEIIDETFAIALDVWAKGKVIFLEDVTSAYRIHNESVTHNRNYINLYNRSISLLRISKDSISQNYRLVTKSEQNNIISKRILSCIKYSHLCKKNKDLKKYYFELLQKGQIYYIIKGTLYIISRLFTKL